MEMKTHNILQILSNLNAGGVGVVTATLSKQFIDEGHKVTIICLKKEENDQLALELSNYGVNLIKYDLKNISNPINTARIYLKMVTFFLKNRQFTTIIMPGINYATLVIPIVKLTFHRARLIVNAHTNITEYMKTQPIHKKLFFQLNRFILPFAHRVSNDSIAGSDDLKNYFSLEKVETLYNPVATDKDIQFEQDYDKAPHPWLKDRNLTTFVGCGRFILSKNFEFMIKVFSQIYIQHPNTRLILIGDGAERQKLESMAKDKPLSSVISFEGFKSNPKEYFYYADYFWLTSFFEGSPLVLGEALSMGTPCIANDCPSGPKEMLENGKYGLLIDNYDINKNAELIHRFIQDETRDRSYYRDKVKSILVKEIARQYLITDNEIC